jgi:Rps23 Pro-64 3,4-dihydroxylase Tpa1-like proline 4-hydroxylase
MHDEFDRLKWSDWRRFDTIDERKRGTLANTRFGHATQLYFDTIHSNVFVEFLQKVTGVEALIPDPTLHAGGLHEIPQGGRFSMHVDFNQHPVSRLDNRLVFITYLNKDWLLSYGGALELHSMDDENCKVAIEPVFGRSALFYHCSKSFHGHPDPVNAPDGRSRRSAAAYFYSNGRSDGESSEYHTTLFPRSAPLVRDQKLANFLKYLTPPVLVDALRGLRRLAKR